MMLPSKVLNGMTFNYEKRFEFGGIDLKLGGFTVSNVDITNASISFKEGTDTIVTLVDGINVNLDLNLEADSVIPIPLEVTQLSLNDLKIQLELATVSTDMVSFQLVEDSDLSLGGI